MAPAPLSESWSTHNFKPQCHKGCLTVSHADSRGLTPTRPSVEAYPWPIRARMANILVASQACEDIGFFNKVPLHLLGRVRILPLQYLQDGQKMRLQSTLARSSAAVKRGDPLGAHGGHAGLELGGDDDGCVDDACRRLVPVVPATGNVSHLDSIPPRGHGVACTCARAEM
jgi:hypothetical protein